MCVLGICLQSCQRGLHIGRLTIVDIRHTIDDSCLFEPVFDSREGPQTLRDQVERYTPEQRRRLRARPGITGLAQISGRSTLPWSQRIVIDVHYVDEWTLRLDLAIILRTIPALLRRNETYPGGIDEVDLG